MQHTIEHNLGFEKAKLVAQKVIKAYKKDFEKYDFQSRWISEERVQLSFSIGKKRLMGTMKVLPLTFFLEMEVPFFYRMFSQAAISAIDVEARKWIELAKNGEL